MTVTDVATLSISSGVPYGVSRPDGTVPRGVADFLGDSSFRIHQRDRHSLVTGTGALDDAGTGVRFYQKDHAHDGRDVRVWHLRPVPDGGFTAEHEAAI